MMTARAKANKPEKEQEAKRWAGQKQKHPDQEPKTSPMPDDHEKKTALISGSIALGRITLIVYKAILTSTPLLPQTTAQQRPQQVPIDYSQTN